MWSGTGNHTPATYEANSGFRTLGFPAAGAWMSYGLGSEVDNLPTFIVLPDARSWPTGGANNWSSGFLPARHQGVVLRTNGPAVRDLEPASKVSGAVQAARFAAVERLNRGHLERHGRGWESMRDGVDGEGGWPLYLQRFVAVVAEDRPGA